MSDGNSVFQDLAAECDSIDELVAGLADEQWKQPTPAPGWTIAHQIAHLCFIFGLAGTAATDAEAFQAMIAGVASGFNAAVNAAVEEYMDEPPQLLARWRAERASTVKALAAAPADQPVPWLVRPLPPAILGCAGIMEAFAHGQDIADALEIRRSYTDRIRHLVGFTVAVWDFGYQSRGMTPPEAALRFELTAPSGALWEFGPADGTDRITGPAADLCLLATRRRHRDDLALVATGPHADQWLDIAQAYRGPAGPGRQPGQFRHLEG